MTQDESNGSRRRRRGGFGPGEWLLLALPVLSGFRLRFGAGPGADVVAANMLVDMAGPGLAMLAFAVGAWGRVALPRECRDDVDVLRRASTARMVAILLAAGLGLWIVFPVDLVTRQGPWRRMIGWAFGVALPAWGAGLFALVRGRRTLVATLASLGMGAVPALLALGFGLFYELSPAALVMPATASGVVVGGGTALAAWFGVTAPGWIVLTVLIVFAAGPGWAVAEHHAHPPIESLEVYRIQDFDRAGGRVLLWVERRDTHTQRLVEVDPATGDATLLRPRDRDGVYAGGIRVTWRRTPLDQSTRVQQPRALCRETTPGGPVACRPAALPPQGVPILDPHPRLPLVLATLIDRIVVWNLESDVMTASVHPGSRIRWPCFSGDGSILYRVETPVGPFTHHRLDLESMESTALGDGHDLQCEPDTPVVPHASFRRGTRRLGIPGRIFASSLPEDGVTLRGNAIVAVWSRDGGTVAMLFDQHTENLGAYSADGGFIDRITIPPPPNLKLSPDGSLLAHATEEPQGWWIVVTEPTTGGRVAKLPSDSLQMTWTDDARLHLVQEMKLTTVEPRSGERRVLFPPPVGAGAKVR